VIGAVLAGLALAAALFVVAENLRKVKPEPLPPALKTAPPDTGLVAFRAGIRRKTRNLSARCDSKRRQLAGRMTPAQDSLNRRCDSAIAEVLRRVADLDTLGRANRRAGADSARAAYDRAKLAVRVFTRSGRRSDLVDDDSLDLEIRKFTGE
jgi:hypothetical protein